MEGVSISLCSMSFARLTRFRDRGGRRISEAAVSLISL